MTTLSIAVLKLSLSNTMILLLPPAPGCVPAAVMAVPLTQMPAPFDGAGPSQGGRKGINELEEKNLHHNLGSIPIVFTPILWIPPYSWYRN
jgi:hypothetical protein